MRLRRLVVAMILLLGFCVTWAHAQQGAPAVGAPGQSTFSVPAGAAPPDHKPSLPSSEGETRRLPAVPVSPVLPEESVQPVAPAR